MGSLDYIRVVEVYGPDIPFHYRFTIAQTIAEMGRGGRESPTALSLTPKFIHPEICAEETINII